jgi:hypothetical protein
MKFRIGHKGEDGRTVLMFVAQVERWWDARTIGTLRFGCAAEELTFQQVSEDELIHVDTRWFGNDGVGMGRRLQWRQTSEEEWREIDSVEYERETEVESAPGDTIEPVTAERRYTIQIAAAENRLYALDSNGDVWQLWGAQWHLMSGLPQPEPSTQDPPLPE